MASEGDMDSVLAKLMGINRLPPRQQPSSRKRIFSPSYVQNIASIAHREKRFFNKSESRMEVNEMLEIEDALQESQTPSYGKKYSLAVTNGSLEVDRAKMSGLKNKLSEVKSLQTDRSSNKFDWKADGLPSHRLDRCAFSIPSSSSGIKSRVTGNKLMFDTHYKCGHLKSSQQKVLADSLISAHSELDRNYLNDSCPQHHRIVDLKPRLTEGDYVRRSFSSPQSAANDPNNRSYSSAKGNGTRFDMTKRKTFGFREESPVDCCKFHTGSAKQITSQLKHRVWHKCLDASNLSDSGCRRDDETSINERNEFSPSSSHLLDRGNEYRTSFTTSDEKSASRRKKKHAMEGWMTRKRFSRLGSTYGHGELWSHGNQDGTTLYGPSKINKMDKSRVVASTYFPGPTSTPFAWTPRSRIRHLSLKKDWCLKQLERADRGCRDSSKYWFYAQRSRSTESTESVARPDLANNHDIRETSWMVTNLNRLEGKDPFEEMSTLDDSSSYTSFCSDLENPSGLETQIFVDEGEDRNQERDFSDESESSPCSFASLSMDVDADNESGVSLKFQRDQLLEPSTCISPENGRETAFDKFGAFIQQLKTGATRPAHVAETELGSPVSSVETVEACSPSPNSVLESNEISPVDGSQRKTGNDLNGLQRKLQLLEAKSFETASQGPGMAICSNEDTENDSVDSYREYRESSGINKEQNRDFSYIVDVLVKSGFPVGNLEMEYNSQQSFENGLDILVFEGLEKKYGMQLSWQRSERRLLFDSIHMAISMILQSRIGINSWRTPVTKRLRLEQSHAPIKDVLWALQVRQEEEVRRESSDKVRGSEVEWLDLGEDMVSIAKDIERKLIDELVAEFIDM